MIVNSLLVRYKGGYFVEEDATSISTYGRHQKLLTLGHIESQDEAESIASLELTRIKDPLDRLTMDADPRASGDDAVYLGWTVGDYVTAPDRSGTQIVRVREINISQDNNSGEVVVLPRLASRLEEYNARLQRIINRRMTGSLDGRSASTGPPPAAESVEVRRLVVESQVIDWPQSVEDFLNVESSPIHFGANGRIVWIQYSWNTPPAADATVVWKVAGATAFTHTLTANNTTHNEFPNYELVRTDDITATVTSVDSTGSGLTAKMHHGRYE